MSIKTDKKNTLSTQLKITLNILIITVPLILFVDKSLTAAPAATTAETHPFSVNDMLAMKRISDWQVSPDGRNIVFVVRETDLEANRGRTDLWTVYVDGTLLRRLTSHPENDSNPRFSPDGKTIWFLSTRSDSSQVWRIAADGGEAVQITDLPLDVANLIVSPDGKHIAFTLEVFPDAPTPEATQKKLDEIAARKSTGRLYDRLFIRHWDTWNDGRRSQLFVMPASGGEPVNVMPGMDADTPSKPFGGPEEIAFTPDSRSIIFTAKDVGRAEAWSTDYDLYLAPIDGSQSPKCLTEDNPAWDANPVFSPDGKTLAYLAMSRPGYESDQFQIILQPWPQGEKTVLTERFDRSPTDICFSADGKFIYTTAPNLAQKTIFSINIETKRAMTLYRTGYNAFPAVAGDRVIFGHDNLKSPVELYSILPNGLGMKRITNINREQLAAVRMGDYERYPVPVSKERMINCYVVKPVDFDPEKKYPVAFLIHGGPQGSFGNHFHYRWNPQAYAGAGYAAVMIDFHGSVGYGQAFTDAIRGDWGGKPLDDLKKGLAFALEKHPWMDGNRVAALGASFGGYMINWIAGNWPERFRCLVNHDGNLDERMAYFDTEELWFPEWDHLGTPWENPQSYEKYNPMNYVQNWKTPMLVIHGANDFRVVDTQGIATFTALQRRGIPSKLLYFSDENHWVLKPYNSILWHQTVIAWLDQWTKK